MTTDTEPQLSSLDLKLVDLLEQYWLIHGKVPTVAQIEEMGIDGTYFKKCMVKGAFRHQLITRGVGIENPDDPKLTDWALDGKQLAAANIMLDLLDNRSRKRKLSDLGISTQEYQAWLRDPAFKAYLVQRSENLLKDNLHEAHAALLDRVRMGDSGAIKLYYELTGRYVPAAARAGSIDPMELITRVLEAVQTHVRDPKVLDALATDLISVAAGAAFNKEVDVIQASVLQNALDGKALEA
jgi:hypothetical protein